VLPTLVLAISLVVVGNATWDVRVGLTKRVLPFTAAVWQKCGLRSLDPGVNFGRMCTRLRS